jgi:hypothetical protein
MDCVLYVMLSYHVVSVKAEKVACIKAALSAEQQCSAAALLPSMAANKAVRSRLNLMVLGCQGFDLYG